MSKVAFVNGLLIDGTGCEPIEKSLVLVDGKKIVYAGESNTSQEQNPTDRFP